MPLDQTLINQLDRFGPDVPHTQPPLTEEQAWQHVRDLTLSHYENFSVLSRLVPVKLRTDFAAVYAFCRWSDDLGDELGASEQDRARSLELLRWWRTELERTVRLARPASDDQPIPDDDRPPRHPVMIMLASTFRRHPVLPTKPFHDLISAFEQDQTVTAYDTWDNLLDYCSRSANPVGRIVLALAGLPDTPEHASAFEMSDATCTALQLTNFWQDAQRDLLDRNRLYMPAQDTNLSRDQLRAWIDTPNDHHARITFIRALRPLVERTRELFIRGRPLPAHLAARALTPIDADNALRIARTVWLFGAGGEHVLTAVERAGCATLWHRPKLGKLTKLWLVARASSIRLR